MSGSANRAVRPEALPHPWSRRASRSVSLETCLRSQHKFEAVVIRLAVDENEIRPDVAVALVARQQCVGGEQVDNQVDNLHQQGIQLLAVPAGFFSPVVTLKAGGVLISRIQTLQQFVRLAGLDQLAPPRGFHRCNSFGVGIERLERQGLFRRDAREQQAKGIGHGEPNFLQRRSGFPLGPFCPLSHDTTKHQENVLAPCQLSAFYARLSADAVSLAGAIMVLLPPSTLYDAVKKATVAVVKSIPGKSPFPYSIVGSGFCIDPDGIIVTCEHVFRDFFTPENREREKQARQAAPGETFTGNCVIPYALFYLGVQEKEHRVASALVPVRHAVKDEKHGFDLALLRLPRPDKQVFPEGYPTFSIADYAELHEMMEIATCGFPLGEALHHQIGTLTSSFTKGMISSIIPAQGVAREHVRGFQLDLTATNGNSGGPVFSIATGAVLGVLQCGAVHPRTGHPVQGLTKAEPIYPLFDTDLLARLPASDPPENRT